MTTTAIVPRRKRRSPGEVRDRIIDAAGREFEENGYSGATTAAIARRAEVTEAQIFRFFASKADLFREAIFQPLNRHFSDFQSRHVAEAGKAGSTEDRARRYIDELQDFMGEHARMLMSLIVARAYLPGTTEGPDEIPGLQAYFARGAAMSRSRTGGKQQPGTELMVRVSFAAVLANVMFRDWLFPPGLASEAEIRAAIADFVIHGIDIAGDGGAG